MFNCLKCTPLLNLWGAHAPDSECKPLSTDDAWEHSDNVGLKLLKTIASHYAEKEHVKLEKMAIQALARCASEPSNYRCTTEPTSDQKIEDEVLALVVSHTRGWSDLSPAAQDLARHLLGMMETAVGRLGSKSMALNRIIYDLKSLGIS
jgi:hypothetical protein